jgi:hypothetical protein
MERKSTNGGFKMKGHTLPGIKQRKSTKMADGRAKSSAFQKDDPVFEGKVYDTVEVKDKAIKPGTFIGDPITGESTIAGSSKRHSELRKKAKAAKTKLGSPRLTGSERKELERLNIATAKAYREQKM